MNEGVSHADTGSQTQLRIVALFGDPHLYGIVDFGLEYVQPSLRMRFQIILAAVVHVITAGLNLPLIGQRIFDPVAGILALVVLFILEVIFPVLLFQIGVHVLVDFSLYFGTVNHDIVESMEAFPGAQANGAGIKHIGITGGCLILVFQEQPAV